MLLQLSQVGLLQVQCVAPLSEGRQTLAPRQDVAMDTWTVWELIITLLGRGWQWAPLPARLNARAKLAGYDLVTAGPSKFYTLKTVGREYLLCLLQPERLKALGLEVLPHGHKAEIYQKLLNGQAVAFPSLHSVPPMFVDVEQEPEASRVTREEASVGTGEGRAGRDIHVDKHQGAGLRPHDLDFEAQGEDDLEEYPAELLGEEGEGLEDALASLLAEMKEEALVLHPVMVEEAPVGVEAGAASSAALLAGEPENEA